LPLFAEERILMPPTVYTIRHGAMKRIVKFLVSATALFFHGHNFELEVRVRGEVDPNTGFVIDLGELGGIIKEQVEDRFDHKNLNVDCPEFENLLPSTEHLAKVIYDILKPVIGDRKLHITLFETAKNGAEYGDW